MIKKMLSYRTGGCQIAIKSIPDTGFTKLGITNGTTEVSRDMCSIVTDSNPEEINENYRTPALPVS